MTSLTPARITERHRSQWTGKLEVWAAVSVEMGEDGKPLWTYERIEDGSSAWEARRSGRLAVTAGSLRSARISTADGSASRALAERIRERASQ
jgi:hypothetical protein